MEAAAVSLMYGGIVNPICLQPEIFHCASLFFFFFFSLQIQTAIKKARMANQHDATVPVLKPRTRVVVKRKGRSPMKERIVIKKVRKVKRHHRILDDGMPVLRPRPKDIRVVIKQTPKQDLSR